MKKTDFITSINILDGVLIYNDFAIDETIPFQNQRDSFKEDLLQITYGDRFLLDVGWYPEMNPKGHFIVYAIQDYDWQNPIVELKCHSLNQLKKTIERVVRIIKRKQRIKNLPLRNVEYESYDFNNEP